jgi:FkbH-like protein
MSCRIFEGNELKILISCSSYLPPSPALWSSLVKNYSLEFSDYGNLASALLNADQNLGLVSVIFYRDLISQDERDLNKLHSIFDLLEARLSKTNAPTILANSFWKNESPIRFAKRSHSSELLEDWVNSRINKLSQDYPNFYSINLDRFFAEDGYKVIFDSRNWYASRCHLSLKGIKRVDQIINTVLNRTHVPAKKVLVLDCDNTLWGGVIGEDGVEGILLGQDGIGKAYEDFQDAAARLASQGTLLVLCSKNNEEDVWEVFDRHKSMRIKKDQIVAWKINWDDKASNIDALAKDLDLGLESFVFWDDNPMERDIVRKALPPVFTVEPPIDVSEWANYLLSLDLFAQFSVSESDAKKTEQYKNRAAFVREKSLVHDEISYLKSIKLKPDIVELDKSNLSRASQMCLKTNQFNLRGRRYSEGDIQNIVSTGGTVFLVRLTDIYGDHGIVGMAISTKISSKFYFLDTFLMSCRVLGRHLEAWILKVIVDDIRAKGGDYIIAERIPTAKNQMASEFLKSHGFKSMQEENLKISSDLITLFSNYLDVMEEAYILDLSIDRIPNIEVYQ